MPVSEVHGTKAAMGRIFSISNQKGGVGKTTTAINLCASLASAEHRTLLVDIDPQGNAGSGLGIAVNELEQTVYDVLLGEAEIGEVIQQTELQFLDVVPANRNLSGAELDLVSLDEREYRLKKALATVRDDYEFIIIDCPPGLGLLTLNALVAADSVIVPLQCEYFALEGIGSLIGTIDLVRKQLNPELEIGGVLLTMYSKTLLAEQVTGEVRKHFGDQVFEAVIPRNIRLSECSSHGKPVILYDLRCAGSEAYLALAREVQKRAATAA